MVYNNKIFSRVIISLATASLLVAVAPIASALSSHESAVTSARSFPKLTNVKRDFLTEATATSVDIQSHWGTIESLNVPQTPSARERVARQREASAAASRSADRQQISVSTPVNPPNGQSVGDLLNFASQFLGKVPYRSGGNTPAGWDCSGFVQYVFANLGISLPRTSGQQATVGVAIPSLAQAQPGDIIANAGHAAIYVGNGMVINSQLSGTQYDPISYVFPSSYAIRRVL